ncbi:MAG: HD domain-containing protein [Phycisphaerales bacterium]|jgi:HD-GYP domain-containing protein (c-di-GMP phosphodiesterase class II)|nr:HD domain-containing protein [Phycisphaerales bacterium]
MSQGTSLQLNTIRGPEVLSLSLEGDQPLTIGRRPEHDLVLASGATVSRDHAVLMPHGSGDEKRWSLIDNGSRHGTILNGVRLEPNRRVPILAGDLIAINPFVLQVVDLVEEKNLTQTIDDSSQAAGTSILRIDKTQGGGLAQEKLAALLNCSRAIHEAGSESAMAAAVAEAAATATAFGNVAIVKPMGNDGMVELLATKGRIVDDGVPNISRSLLDAAMDGEPVRFQRAEVVDEQAQSIMQYSIEEALCVPIMLGHAVAGCIYLDNRDGQLQGHNVPDDVAFCTGLAEITALAMSNLMRVDIERRHASERQNLLLGTVGALVAAIDAKDTYTRGHSVRVAWLAKALASAIGLDDQTLEEIHICGLVHDIGKIGIPESILRKPNALTDDEYDRIKEHPVIGEKILSGVPQLAQVLPGVRSHHERWDGRGYPDQTAGKETPFFGRLLGIADAFDAMCSSRAYRDGLNRSEVLDEVKKCSNTQFDPELVEKFLTLDFSEYDRMIEKHTSQEAL